MKIFLCLLAAVTLAAVSSVHAQPRKPYRVGVVHEGGPYVASVVTQGALVGYGVNRYDEGKLSAKYVQRVLTGTSPRDMPVESFSRFELGINLQTAHKLGIAIPQAVLFRADKVVE